MYHGGGGFKHEEVYNMPTWMRRFHIEKINRFLKKQKEEEEKMMKKHSPASNAIKGPNIKPSSTYNFKK